MAAVEYLDKAPPGMSDRRRYLFDENDGKMFARFSVKRHPVVLRAYGLAEDQCLCIKQLHRNCCGEDVVSDIVECCDKQHCLTCCDNRLYVATPGDYFIDLDAPNGEAIVTIEEIKHEQLKFEVKEWL